MLVSACALRAIQGVGRTDSLPSALRAREAAAKVVGVSLRCHAGCAAQACVVAWRTTAARALFLLGQDGVQGMHCIYWPSVRAGHPGHSRCCCACAAVCVCGFAGSRARPVPHRLVVDVREFMSGLPAVLHMQGFRVTPITLEVRVSCMRMRVCVVCFANRVCCCAGQTSAVCAG